MSVKAFVQYTEISMPIYRCMACPKYRAIIAHNKSIPWCGWQCREIEDPWHEIPGWCPLPEYKEYKDAKTTNTTKRV